MDKLFASLKSVTKLSNIVTDNAVFKLHYKVTVTMLIAFSLTVTSYQYIGEPIACISKDDIPTSVLDSFCWIHSTFSVVDAWKKEVGVEVPYPGVDKYSPGEKRVYHAYYQWVCFMLFFQAILFYAPRFFWKAMESGRVKALIMELDNPVLDEKKKENAIDLLAKYLVNSSNSKTYFLPIYSLAEILNFLNVIGQMYLLDKFLGNAFYTYGLSVMKFSEWDYSTRYDPMIQVFPRLTKCTFHRFGSSGDVQIHDAMCILPINIINEKIFIFLWFWFVLLTVFSIIALIYRSCIYLSPRLRIKVLQLRAPFVPVKDLMALEKFSKERWFLFYLLAKNIDSIQYRDLMKCVSSILEKRKTKVTKKEQDKGETSGIQSSLL